MAVDAWDLDVKVLDMAGEVWELCAELWTVGYGWRASGR